MIHVNLGFVNSIHDENLKRISQNVIIYSNKGAVYYTEEAESHEYIREQFGFPEYYGRNLDVLYDMLTEIGEDTVICIIDRGCKDKKASEIFQQMILVIQGAAENSEYVSVRLENEKA